MSNAKDVAAYILNAQGPMSAMKLQKLCFYSQAYSLAWFGEPLFHDRIEAWTNGPVIKSLWWEHKGKFSVSEIKLDRPIELSKQARAVIDSVLSSMGGLTGKQLSDRTHEEAPWRNNYDGDDAYPNREITHSELREFYGVGQPT